MRCQTKLLLLEEVGVVAALLSEVLVLADLEREALRALDQGSLYLLLRARFADQLGEYLMAVLLTQTFEFVHPCFPLAWSL